MSIDVAIAALLKPQSTSAWATLLIGGSLFHAGIGNRCILRRINGGSSEYVGH
jgi:hypothetical protein